jgi:hypothetical protein
LVAAGRLSPPQWGAVRSDAAGGAPLGDLLADHGVDRHELQALTESVLVDSILALLTGPAVGAAGGRFRSDAPPWTAAELRLDEAAVRDVLAQRPAGSVHATIRSTSVVEPAAPQWRWRVVTAEEWRILCRIGERARVRDLARAGAVGVYEVVDEVAELVLAGLCVVRPDPAGPDPYRRVIDVLPWPDDPEAVPAEGAVPAQGTGPDSGAQAAATGENLFAALPRRVPGQALPPVTDVLEKSLATRAGEADTPAPDKETLRRLLGSLQQMD